MEKLRITKINIANNTDNNNNNTAVASRRASVTALPSDDLILVSGARSAEIGYRGSIDHGRSVSVSYAPTVSDDDECLLSL